MRSTIDKVASIRARLAREGVTLAGFEVGNALLQAERRACLKSVTRLELLDAFTSLSIVLEPNASGT